MILNRCTKKPFNITNSYLKFFIGFMWNLETVDAIQELQRNLCNFVGMVISVSLRKSAHYHVSIANCFYLSQNGTKFTLEIVRIFTEERRLVSVLIWFLPYIRHNVRWCRQIVYTRYSASQQPVKKKPHRIHIMTSKMWKKTDFFFDIYEFKNLISYFVLNLW